MSTFLKNLNLPSNLKNRHSEEFHGHLGRIAILKDGKSARIIGGEGLKLFMQGIDGTTFECYHDNIDYIWEE